ncbi:hypothetical protein HNR23_003433 [Nocardiopsis mwathae]|uniref:SEC-C motif-containing protein n=1 Tax=Nocardiopsis mwathae TaxID=1472723 RepID=A0A7X0D6J4_9ACTN|nr:SEC-C domain-containing protein [Nocardiopsis mwathae]MBB6173373.1 hypothetical protein [Nocardiopsis mwathae]
MWKGSEFGRWQRDEDRIAVARRMAWRDGRSTIHGLLQFRSASRRAGVADPEARTLEFCDRLIREGDRQVSLSARYFKVMLLREQGQPERAMAELEVLERCAPTVHTAEQLGSLWAADGDLERALHWYTCALTLECPADGAAQRDRRQAGRNRTAVRTQLGLPPDELDFLLFQEDIEAEAKCMREHPDTGAPVLTPYFPRSEVERAAAAEALPPGVDAELYYQRSEVLWQIAAETHGVWRRLLVPVRVEDHEIVQRLPSGPDDQPGTREYYLLDQAERVGVTHWPPHDPAPCWCMSGQPYACCCGRPRR